MGKHDTVTKEYMSDNDIFADIFNYFLYDGEQRMKGEGLKELDSAELGIVLENDTGDAVQKYRDILRQCVMKGDGKTSYVLLGLENQTDIHYAMPVRSMLYDALHCASQVSEIAREHREKGTYGSSGEFLSGFHKSDRLWPVQTLVVYFGSMRWDGPRSLQEMLVLPEGMKRPFLRLTWK